MSSTITLAVVVIAIGATIIRRFIGEPLRAHDLFVMPLILTGIGIYGLTKIDHWSGIDLVWMPVGVMIGIAFGAVRGTTTVLFAKNGALHQRYTWRTAAIWVASFLVGGGFGLLGASFGVHPEVRPMMLSIGVGLIGEMATTGLRALSTGRAFAVDRSGELSSADMWVERMNARRSPADLEESPSFRDAVRVVRRGTSVR